MVLTQPQGPAAPQSHTTEGKAALVLPAAGASLRSRWRGCFLTHCCFQTDPSRSAGLWHRPECPEWETPQENVRGHGDPFVSQLLFLKIFIILLLLF